MNKEICEYFDDILSDAKCTLNYNKDYELLIATILSAQCTDERVNKVTKILFDKYDIFGLSKAEQKDIIDIIRPCGNMNIKSKYIINNAKRIVDEYNGIVPNDREFLESLDGVGRKTANVFLGNIYNVPTFAVDTHVKRVTNRLGLVNTDDVLKIEEKLMSLFNEEEWVKRHHQFLLFGRYYCKAKNPLCDNCRLKDKCNYYNDKKAH